MSGIIMNPMYELLKQRRWEKRQKKYEQMRAEAKGKRRSKKKSGKKRFGIVYREII